MGYYWVGRRWRWRGWIVDDHDADGVDGDHIVVDGVDGVGVLLPRP